MKLDFTSRIERREYSVEKRIECSNPQNPSGLDVSSITEVVSITIDKSNALDPIAKVEVSNVKQDGRRRPDNPINQYFLKSGELLNKLVLSLSSDGRIQRVVNRDEVLQNWEYIKIYLDNYFVSDDENVLSTIKEWTNQIGISVKNESQFLQIVRSDSFYNFYFYGYWLNYSRNNQLTIQKSHPAIFGSAKTVFNETLQISGDDGFNKVKIVGVLDKDASDMIGIASFLGIGEKQTKDLTVELNGTCVFDALGLVDKMDICVDVNLDNLGLHRSYILKVNND